MPESPLAYIPTDRRHALARGDDLPRRTEGAALFADISGFTPLTEALVTALGPQRGAEELLIALNRIYDALVEQVDAYRGSVIAFSGDAITCWFDQSGDGGWPSSAPGIQAPDPVQRAVATSFAIQATMQQFATFEIQGAVVPLAVKVAVTAGPAVRFVVGDPAIEVIDALAGETVQRLAAGEHLAERGEVLIDQTAAGVLGDRADVVEWREDAETGDRFAVVRSLDVDVPVDPWPELPADALSDDVVRTWMLPPVAARLEGGMGEFLTELRPAVSLFVRFSGIDYDNDPAAEQHLDAFIRAVQVILDRFDSYILQITIGDKGSYINTAFGAPVAHGDDAVRAATAALELIAIDTPSVGELQIGIAQGRTRTGAFGGVTRRCYGVLGDAVNLSARLMQRAAPDEILVEQSVRHATGDAFIWDDIEPFAAKGKSQLVVASRLTAAHDRASARLRLPEYALPMVGRQAELASIMALHDVALAGRGQVVAVVADAGMGKSRLVAEVIHRARDHDIIALGGECQSYGVNASYLVWHNIWRGFFDIDGTLPADEQLEQLERHVRAINPRLVERVPVLGAVLNMPIADNELTASFDAPLRKTSLESLLVACLRSKARQQPVLLVLEDCHWLDPLSHDLLEVVGRAIADVPVLLLMAYRPRLAPHLEAPRVSQLPHFTEVVLDELPHDELSELVTTKLQALYGPEAEALPELVEELSARAQGNPFYLEELLNYLKDRGVDPQEPGALSRLDLPTSLYSLILGRIDQLTEDQKTLLKVASVIGRLFQVAMLWGVYQPFAEQPSLRSDLITLADMELTSLDSPEPELAYLFKHVLTQEVAYETLSFATRAMLHDQIGQYIEARHPGFVEQHLDLLAYHYDRSENTDKRREFLRKAGHAAQAASANLSAISYYERVLPLLEGHDLVEVLLQFGQVQELVGDWPAAESSDRQALAVADSLPDVLGQARAQLALGVLERKRGAYTDAVQWSARARDSFERAGDNAGMSRAISDLGEVHRMQGRYPDARANYEHSLQIAEQVVDPDLRGAATAHALKGAGTVATWQGDYDAAMSLNEQSLTIRRQLADKPGVAVLLNNQGILARFQHDLDTARQMNDESLALFREIGDQWAVGQLLNNQACVAADQADYDEAQSLLHESLTIRRQLGDRAGLALSLNTLADVLIDIGQYFDAVPLLDESMAIDKQLGDQTGIAYLIEDYAGVAASQGLFERALRLAGFAAALREAIGAPLPPNEQARVERMVQPARATLDEPTAAQAWAEGRAMGEAQAVDEVLASP
ncbi:MAG: adenylate/guanylate cyclase [Ilumatobacteraceae bacterium]|nr:adenylate/guanylate cyclase [Ilumatobacteraceae bacterium]